MNPHCEDEHIFRHGLPLYGVQYTFQKGHKYLCLCEVIPIQGMLHPRSSNMKRSVMDATNIKQLLQSALTNKIADRETFMKGIDYSYYYEQED